MAYDIDNSEGNENIPFQLCHEYGAVWNEDGDNSMPYADHTQDD